MTKNASAKTADATVTEYASGAVPYDAVLLDPDYTPEDFATLKQAVATAAKGYRLAADFTEQLGASRMRKDDYEYYAANAVTQAEAAKATMLGLIPVDATPNPNPPPVDPPVL